MTTPTVPPAEEADQQPACEPGWYPATNAPGAPCIDFDPCVPYNNGTDQGATLHHAVPCTATASRVDANVPRSGCPTNMWPASYAVGAACVPYDKCVPSNGVDGPGASLWQGVLCFVETEATPVAESLTEPLAVTAVGRPSVDPVASELPATGMGETGAMLVIATVLVGFGAMTRRLARR